VLNSSIYANDFREVRKISLNKDEKTKIYVKYGTHTKLLTFSWTLYINGGLVIHRSYDKIVGQNVLYLNYKNQSFRQELLPRGLRRRYLPYILVKFKAFDSKKNRALFELYLSDEELQVDVKYPKKRKRENAKS
jgi:hypothetical protein